MKWDIIYCLLHFFGFERKEGTSDASDVEQRLKGLENKLQRRRAELQKLRKKKEKNILRQKEEELRKELQVVEQQINRENKENLPPESHQGVTKVQPRVLSPRNSLDSIILPEKIKFPSDKESRRSLDFSDRESDTEKSIDVKSTLNIKYDTSVHHSRSHKTATQRNEFAKQFTDHSVHSSAVNTSLGEKRSVHVKPKLSTDESLASIPDVGLADADGQSASLSSASEHTPSEKADSIQTSIVSEHAATEKAKSSNNSIVEELSSHSPESKMSEKDDDIYEDDFFESDASKVKSSIKGDSTKTERNKQSYEDDFEETADQSAKYSNKFDSEKSYSEISKKSTSSNDIKAISNHIDVSHRSISERINELMDDLSETSRGSNHSSPSSSHSSHGSSHSSRRGHSDTSSKSSTSAVNERTLSSIKQSSKHFEQLVSKKFDDVLKPSEPVDKSDTSLISSELVSSKSSNSISNRAPMSEVKSNLPTSEVKSNLPTSEVKSNIPESLIKTKRDSLPTEKSLIKTTQDSLPTEKSASSSSLVQPDVFTKSDVSSVFGFHVNNRVLVDNTMSGTIRYLGKTPFSPVLVAGIELDKAMGTNNGTFQEKQYFVCPQDYGLFTTLERLNKLKMDEDNGGADPLSDTSTIEEVEESLSHGTLTQSDHDNSQSMVGFDNKSSSHSSTSLNLNDASRRSDSLASVKSVDVIEAAQSAAQSVESFLKEDRIDIHDHKPGLDLELKSRSSSDIESLDGEIPSPEKLDLAPLADSITDSIMQNLLIESLQFPLQKTETSRREQELISTERLETPEAYVTPKGLQIPTPIKENISATERDPGRNNSIDVATRHLLNEAVSCMVNVQKQKVEKLRDSEPSKFVGKEITDNFLSLIVDSDSIPKSSLNRASSEESDELDSDLLAAKLNQLKTVHDQLGVLLGVDDDDDIEDDNEVDDELQVPPPPHGFGIDEQVLQIPFTEQYTRELILLACGQLSSLTLSLNDLNKVQPSYEYISLDDENENLDEASTKLYKTLIFEIAKSLMCDIKDFRELQTKSRPQWMKVPRKTFSKFTRKTHLLEKEDFREILIEHVCACLDLRAGRPSLEKLKRKLPLNLSKKDYVDAILVEELREEEAQWVNYDDDELRVKFQLADAILDNLIEETSEVISALLL